MNSRALLFATFVACLPLYGSPSPTPSRPQLTPVEGEPNHIRQLELRQGQTCSFPLPSNPSTGYCWMAVTEANTPSPLRVEMSPVPPPAAPEGAPRLVGAPGKELITFTALHPGKALVKLRYTRPWETPPADAEPVLIIRVIIKP